MMGDCGRWRRWAAALAAGISLLATGVMAGAPSPAAAAEQPPSLTVTLGNGASARASSTLGLLTSGTMIVPGDAHTWRVAVRSAGEGPGRLTAELIDVRVTGADDAEFRRDFRIAGRPLSELLGRRTTIATRELAAGASTSVPVGYEFPAAATSGNHPAARAITVTFDVVFTLRGQTPTVSPTATPTSAASASITPVNRSGSLALTGMGALAVLPVAAVLTAVGWYLLALRRRRAEESRGRHRAGREAA